MTMNDESGAHQVQPCEICGRTDEPDPTDKYDDVYFPARPGSKSAQLGYLEERLCGRCGCAQYIGSYWNGTPQKGRTPIETYAVYDKLIYVKRDDLWNNGKYGGGNAKMRGIEVHIRRMIESGIDHIAVLDSRTSRIGWGVAQLCRDLGIKCTVYYGTLQKDRGTVPYFQQQAKAAGANLIEMPASRIYPMYYKARIDCHERTGAYLLPMGGQLTESILSVSGEAASLPKDILGGTFICVVATGTMFAGIMMSLKGEGRTIGVYIGMTSGELSGRSNKDPEQIVRQRIINLMPDGYDARPFEIRLGDREYYAEDNYPCPFPCDKWYDRKAWRWLCSNITDLKEPIVFWNVG